MAAPVVVSVSPSSGATGVLRREPVVVLFDSAVDTDSLDAGNFALATTAYRVTTTGPASVEYEEYLDPDTLSTSGYRGYVSGEISYKRINLLDTDEYAGGDDYTGSASLWRTQLTFSPSYDLEASSQFTAVLGSSIYSRTISDVESAISGTGSIIVKGPYLGSIQDTYIITVTEAGKRSTTKYRWSRTSDGYISEELTSSRASVKIRDDENISIAFGKGIYSVGDTFTFVTTPGEVVESTYSWTFETGTTSDITPTEEAEEIDVRSVIEEAELGSTSTATSDFRVSSVSPSHASGNMATSTNTVVFTFSDDVDSATITEDSLYITGVSVDNIWNNVWNDESSHTYPGAGDIERIVAVSGKVVTVILNYGGSASALPYNNEIRIYITSDVKSTDGVSLDNYMYYFTTRYDPIYVDISQVYNKMGSVLGTDFYEDTIYRLILRYSKIADIMSEDKTFRENTRWQLLRAEWVLCNVVLDLARNVQVVRGSADKKRLGDLSVSYDPAGSLKGLTNISADAEKCITALEEQMRRAVTKTVAVAVKGCKDPENPSFGRDIQGYPHSDYPWTNAYWYAKLRSTYYTSSRLSERIMGNIKRTDYATRN